MADNSGLGQGRRDTKENKNIQQTDFTEQTSMAGQRSDQVPYTVQGTQGAYSTQDMGQGAYGYGQGMSQQGMQSSNLGKDVGNTNFGTGPGITGQSNIRGSSDLGSNVPSGQHSTSAFNKDKDNNQK